jgi:3-phenylpropionate/cinnamic acid dioxygenase small subunit
VESDRQIENLIYRYAELIDAGDFEGIGRLFRHGRIIAGNGSNRSEVVGSDAVTALYEATTRRYPDDGTPHTRHVTSNVIIEVETGAIEATARSYFTVLQQTDEIALQAVVSGSYHDTFRELEGTWWFDTREMIVGLVGDLSRHLLIEL